MKVVVDKQFSYLKHQVISMIGLVEAFTFEAYIRQSIFFMLQFQLRDKNYLNHIINSHESALQCSLKYRIVPYSNLFWWLDDCFSCTEIKTLESGRSQFGKTD